MLLKVHSDDTSRPRSKSHLNNRLENMTVTYYPELALFLQSVDESAGTFKVSYSPPGGAKESSLAIALEPGIEGLEVIDVTLHNSPAKAYRMGSKVNDFFSQCFGYEVILAYLGPNQRSVLGNLSPNAGQKIDSGPKSWLSSVTSSLPTIMGSESKKGDGIWFADVAAYLVVTEESLKDVSARLPEGTEMDITKFRPNIVLSGAAEAWDEDYWAGLTIGNNKSNATENTKQTEFALTQNCPRCVSINIDYTTGRAGENVLKTLMKDRRVDKGAKYSPIFGRYGFLKSEAAGQWISIGDEVMVSKRNEERTTFGESLY